MVDVITVHKVKGQRHEEGRFIFGNDVKKRHGVNTGRRFNVGRIGKGMDADFRELFIVNSATVGNFSDFKENMLVPEVLVTAFDAGKRIQGIITLLSSTLVLLIGLTAIYGLDVTPFSEDHVKVSLMEGLNCRGREGAETVFPSPEVENSPDVL